MSVCLSVILCVCVFYTVFIIVIPCATSQHFHSPYLPLFEFARELRVINEFCLGAASYIFDDLQRLKYADPNLNLHI